MPASNDKDMSLKIEQLLKVNKRLTDLHWIAAQIASEQDINNMYNQITNGFSYITGVDKCAFYSIDEKGNFIELINSRHKEETDPFWLCDGVQKVLKETLQKRVAVISLNQSYCGSCSHRCNLCVQVCCLYSRGGSTKGLLVAYNLKNESLSEEWIRILELYAMQMSLTLENAILNIRLRELSITDGLTGLRNHRHFMECLNSEVERSFKRQRPFCVFLLDVDDFKHYNDNYGHPAGDEVLQILASIMTDTIDENGGTVFRYGGEEFAVILPQSTLKQGFALAEKLRQNIDNHNFPHRAITVSIGVSAYPENAREAKQLLNWADKALYQAKAKGKNKVQYL
ncbi:sensor domain-containing diguanylate cyclase [Desulfofalx alkaliphila]|uniref:sensor domain-containing diguanylate cyclase n=1 Tax=Desulfofalx alkaliphila TaxID=105483 RepID=UPI0004E0E62D|nr:sensor domain-containing diguanylate cyclase [Desulfofalx alkaliphila]